MEIDETEYERTIAWVSVAFKRHCLCIVNSLTLSLVILSENLSEEDGRKLKVTMVSWDASDKWVITAVNDFSV